MVCASETREKEKERERDKERDEPSQCKSIVKHVTTGKSKPKGMMR